MTSIQIQNTPLKAKQKAHEKLRNAMFSSGYRQEDMAAAMGLSFSAFNLKINGKRDFSLSECILIAKELGKTLDDIFFN